MKVTKLILLTAAVLFSFASTSFAQSWSFVGFVSGGGTFPSISVTDPMTSWIAGGPSGQPKVYKSTNGGVNYADVSGNLTGNELSCVWAVDANTCYVGDGGAPGGAGGNAKVWKTTNGGTSWTTIFTTGGTAGYINGITFSRTNPTVGIIESDPPAGAGTNYWWEKTSDGGATWTNIMGPTLASSISSQNTVVVTDANHFGVGTSATSGNGHVIFTTNGGTAWNLPLISATGVFTSAYAMASDWVNGIAATSTSLPVIGRTTNGGTSWSTVNGVAGLTGICAAKWVPTTQRVYMMSTVGASGCAEQSTDGGATWSIMNTAAITGITSMDLVYVGTTVTAYAVASDGSVIYMQTNLTGIDPNNNSVPTSYKLEQNYPNPFNPTTNIRYSLPKASNVSVKLYDMLGHEVMTVINSYRNAGNYVETVDASKLASGVYFYTIKADNFTETKKMSLVK